MKRFASQWLLCSDLSVLKNHMIEIEDNKQIVQLADLNSRSAETAGTVFLNGIIAPEVVSLSLKNIPDEKVLTAGYGLFRAVNGRIVELFRGLTDKFIIDFGTEDVNEITALIQSNNMIIREISLEHLIHACTYAPASFLQNDVIIKSGALTGLSVWENVDFKNHLLTVNTQVRYL